MSSTTTNPPWSFSPPPRDTAPADNGGDRPRSSSLYLFTFLSTLFLLLVVSSAIVLRSFLLRRRYRMGLQEQLDEIFRPPGEPSAASRRKNFGAKPKLWDTWVKLDDGGGHSVNELAEIKPLAVTFVPREPPKPNSISSTPPAPPPEQERRNERSSAFLAGLFTSPLPLPRHPSENDRPGGDSANSSAEISRAVQVSIVISMPTQNHRKPSASDSTEEEFPNVAIGFTRLPIASE